MIVVHWNIVCGVNHTHTVACDVRVISREKEGVQVREMMETSGIGIAVREPTAGRRPMILLFEHCGCGYARLTSH